MPSLQTPLHSGFGPASTAAQTPGAADLTCKIALVTGGYSCIGLETTRALARAGATVIVPARNPDKARQALSAIPTTQQARIDLVDPDSIQAFAAEFLASGRPLHLLINNAASWRRPWSAIRAATSFILPQITWDISNCIVHGWVG